MREIHHILFDLDGTLVDSSAAIRASLDHALRGMGLAFPDHRPVEQLIGMPLVDIFREAFGVTGEPAERAIAGYRRHSACARNSPPPSRITWSIVAASCLACCSGPHRGRPQEPA